MSETNRPVVKRQTPRRSFLFPIFLIVLGVIFLLNNLGLLADNAWDLLLRLWPVLLIAWGLDDLIRRDGAAGPMLMIGLGVVFLLNNYGLISVGVWSLLIALWPLLLVAWGFDLILSRRSAWLALLGAILMLVILAGALLLYGVFTPMVTLQGDTVQHSLGDASTARITLQPAVGELNLDALAAGGDELIAGKVATPSGVRVVQDVSQQGDEARVALRTAGTTPNFGGNLSRWEWNLGLNPDVVIDLDVEMGAGQLNLDLRRLSVEDARVDLGVGEATIYLPEEGSTKAEIASAIGRLVVVLPKGMEARVEVDRALTNLDLPAGMLKVDDNTYQSAGYDETAEHIELDLSQAIGNIAVRYE